MIKHRFNRAVVAAVTLAGFALIAACSGDGETLETAGGDTASSTKPAAVSSSTTSTAVATKPATTAKPVTSSTAKPATSASSSSTASTASTATTTASTATTASTTASSSTPPSTAGSGLGAATTIGGGAGADTGIYQGVLGKLRRDERRAEPSGPQPTSASGILPLTGQPGSVPQRPAAVVKIDNGGPARPQTGLNSADIVIEEEVEGGITRFAAVFHSQSSIVGPIRSGRTTDISIINGFGDPLLMYSGANSVTDALLRAQHTVQNRNAGTSSGYYRSSSRRAPSNLYSDTAPHWASASGGPPRPQFHYRADGESVAGSNAGTDDGDFSVHYRANTAGWSWVGSHYVRTQGGKAHMTAGAGQVASTNVVVIEAEEVATGMVDSSGATVPEFLFVGTGKATVFTGGKRYEGRWTRPILAAAPVLTTADGTLIKLNPGRTWIELVRANSGALHT